MSTFEARLAYHRPRLQRAAFGLYGDREAAREAAQETLTRAWAARDRFDPRRPLYPWLSTILRNLARDQKARRRPVLGLDAERVLHGDPGPLARLTRAEGEARLHAALETLSDPHREILVMRHFEDLSYAEIALALGVAEGTVMSRLYRARKALVKAMRGER